MASVYQRELNERPTLDWDAKRLLFAAAFFSRAFSTPGELLSFCPSLKRLDDWVRVFDRIRDCGLWADEIKQGRGRAGREVADHQSHEVIARNETTHSPSAGMKRLTALLHFAGYGHDCAALVTPICSFGVRSIIVKIA
jgi:hypothetical protein